MAETNTIDITGFIQLLSDPNTKKIFKDVTIIGDNKLCELQNIPEDDNSDIRLVLPLKSFIEDFLDEFPEFKKLQFIEDTTSKNHIKHKLFIEKKINANNFSVLLDYENFYLKYFTYTQIKTAANT